ncbi:hypothetical protein EHQ68_00565 [Leptospira congkakensis]|uniref:Uncharacterized protein n=1 Tax=Leptospira congkakensis TaxID=2484932 RepID=A0A4Z1A983_9LEPT|nr:hypothetical protein [Leptospira congkakensis]TGL87886.1 hypothetical protein EHQ69_17500 [Leptospira congkakensis]TGL92663.1 hypothetical protein EHQ68_00565 [Leptospira congkakensis]TGL96036.1 hypothetical protein EHQ70_13170 [Leptospira congkakensis]
MEWIRTIPSDFPRDQKISLGTYQRPTEKKSAFGSKDYQLYWQEEIHLQSNSKFVKTWSEWKVYKDHSEFQFKEGTGSFEKSGDWVLFKTNSITEFECKSKEKVDTIPRGKDWKKSFPCSDLPSQNIRSKDHNLLYYYDGKSIFPLQYESGYAEANFGIAWESDLPYTKSSLFEKAKLKYGKKEFQPHVYNHVKLD